MGNKMFNEFEKVHEIIVGAEYKAVHASTALGGLSIEAFQKEDDAILRVVSVADNNKVDIYQQRRKTPSFRAGI
ncbi:MAG: hypothetical protein PHT38_02465 [Halothiobacillus sp.]|jgi:hypothetical protein|nr:hypothetical protein [Halothiobacillus sp.]